MARTVLIKDIRPTATDIILSIIAGNLNIPEHDEKIIYHVGDRVYKIIDGKIVVKECIVEGTQGPDFTTNWTIVESIIGDGGTQNPNSFQNISHIEKKITSDIATIANRVHTALDLSGQNLNSTFILPLYTDDEVTLDGGVYDFGRVIV